MAPANAVSADTKTPSESKAAPAASMDAVSAQPSPQTSRKEPPPEAPADIRRRSLVVLSFWLVVLCLGVPIWWRTTEIYRAALPLDEMLLWAEGKACRPVFPLQVSVQAPSLPQKDAENLLHITQHALDDLNEFPGHHLRLHLETSADGPAEPAVSTDTNDVALTVLLTPNDGGLAAALDPQAPILSVTYPPTTLPTTSASSSPLAAFVADELRTIFAEEQTILAAMLSSTRDARLSAYEAAALANRVTRSLRYAPTYHLTFSLFTAGPTPNTWDIEAAIADYVKPVLDVLAPIHNFTIDTQVQLYATPGAQALVLTKDDLASFINAAEWPLSPSIGGALTVNFLVFISNQTIALGGGGSEGTGKSTSQSWLIPQWGTVYLLAPPATSPDSLSSADLKQPMLTFTGHLLNLLGAPQTGSLPLRLSTLSRLRSADVLLRASSTLGSLARLAHALPSISIPSSVADGVSKTIAHLKLACKSLGGPESLMHGRIAEREAERAFFEKSMVGQLYFPDEHKVAVYLPLLGPVGVPLFIGLINEIKGWRKRRRERAEREAAAKELAKELVKEQAKEKVKE